MSSSPTAGGGVGGRRGAGGRGGAHGNEGPARQQRGERPRDVPPADAVQEARRLGLHARRGRRPGAFRPCYRPPTAAEARLRAVSGVCTMALVYDLMLLLDTAATDAQRAKILADTEAAITAEGTPVG